MTFFQIGSFPKFVNYKVVLFAALGPLVYATRGNGPGITSLSNKEKLFEKMYFWVKDFFASAIEKFTLGKYFYLFTYLFNPDYKDNNLLFNLVINEYAVCKIIIFLLKI